MKLDVFFDLWFYEFLPTNANNHSFVVAFYHFPRGNFPNLNNHQLYWKGLEWNAKTAISSRMDYKRLKFDECRDQVSHIRRKVFIEEQNCPESMEWDENEENESLWFVAFRGDTAVGCLRLRNIEKDLVKMERVAVLKVSNLWWALREVFFRNTDVVESLQNWSAMRCSTPKRRSRTHRSTHTRRSLQFRPTCRWGNSNF